MRALTGVAIVALAGSATACGGDDGASAPTSTTPASTVAPTTMVIPAQTVPRTAPQTTPATTMASSVEVPMSVAPPASAVPTVSESDAVDMERTLDEIDQVLSDLEADLAADHE